MVWAKDFSSSALSSVIKWPMAVTVSHLFLLISPNKSTFTNHFYNIFNTFRGSETFLDHLGYVDWGLFPDISIFLKIWDFPGSPEVKTSPSNAGGVGSIPGRGAKIPHASRPKNQKHKKKKQYCNKFNKDFKIHAYEIKIKILSYYLISLHIYIYQVGLKSGTLSEILYLRILVKILNVFYPCSIQGLCGICHTLVPAWEIKASEGKPHNAPAGIQGSPAFSIHKLSKCILSWLPDGKQQIEFTIVS